MTERHESTRAAFTALEVMFALAILAVGMLALMAAISSGDALNQQTREVELAIRVAAQRLELYRGTAPTAIITQIGTSQTITTGINENQLKSPSLTLQVLSEAETEAEMGMTSGTLDLDDDTVGGENSANSTRSNYRIAPVRATISWTSAGNVVNTRTIFTIYYPQSTVPP